ncbi:MAG TPA: CoA ester lyase [Anaerolineae bacterium]|nr:CoA ester lyase [Caldilineae bacterium]HID33013.1 CoA ester lyase [Anaerolineae bacterium]
MRPRRALLYVPGASMKMMTKAASLGVDSVCLDLEDAVALAQKEEARRLVARALAELDFGRTERGVRINEAGGDLARADLEAILPHHPDAIILPKVDSPEALRWADALLLEEETRRGWRPGGIALIALIETAMGVVRLAEIAAATPRLQALAFGAEDLMADVGGKRTPSNREVAYPRSAVAITAAAFGLQALDQVFVAYKDLDGFRAEAEEAAILGFQGKQVIHPAQAQVAHEAFAPSEEEIAHARRVLAAMREAEAKGEGVFALDGKMVDGPMIKAARRILSQIEGS